jgi:putative zinc finger protein
MTCMFAHHDGAYVLGALSPAERRAFEDHLPGCAACTRAVGELAGLPGLLAHVDAETVASPEVDEPVPDTLLPTLLHRVRRERRRRTLAVAGIAAAAVLAVGGATVAVTGVPGNDSPPPSASAGPSAAAPVGEPMQPIGTPPVSANLALASVPWGTRLDLTCTYGVAGEKYTHHGSEGYTLVVHTRDGRVEQVASWRPLPGRTMRLAGATSARRSEIASVEVRTMEGEPVLELAG